MPTSRNARGIDIIAYNHNCEKMISVQVKTLSKPNAVPLGASLDNLMGDYWVVINNAYSDEKRTAFILTLDEVKEIANRNKTGECAYWLERRDYERVEHERFINNWDKIGRGDE